MTRRPKRAFTDQEIAELLAIYTEAEATGRRVDLREFCERTNRHRTHVCRKARQLGLNTRPKWGSGKQWAAFERRQRQEREQQRQRQQIAQAERAKRQAAAAARHAWLSTPLGAVSAETLRRQVARKAARRARESWLAKTEDERRAITAKQKQTMLSRYGRGAVNKPDRNHTRGVGGIRADLGIYVRSTWEANWARYLNLGIAKGIVEWWKYEPQTFTFPEGVDDEVRSYTPDFLVRMADGAEVYHEVKGWMTARYRRAIELFRVNFPDVRLRVFTRRDYQELTKRWRHAIPEWEHCPSKTRRKLARERDARRIRECKQCGKSFRASAKGRVFCSGECSKRAECVAHCEKQRAKTRATRPTHGQCEWCGDEFAIGGMGRIRRLCSTRCQTARWRATRQSIYTTA